ncbi:MAG: zinc ribbon domain-containing protein [Anaerolineae bacterium]|nr:zinc ribbon domain-containing protein [Anaerolineae bacterium]
MVRKSKGFVELEWTCPNCETRNKGSIKTCVNCGGPQPEDVQFEAPSQKKFVSDEKAEELRKRGADIHCGFCGTRNPSTAETCSQCGGDLSEGTARQAGRKIDMAEAKLEKITCSNCGTENSGADVNCQECGAALARAKRPPQPKTATGKRPLSKAGAAITKKKPNWKIWGAIGAGLLLCCAAIGFLTLAPISTEQATVSDVYWKTEVAVQEIRPVDYDDRSGSPPSDAYNVSCYTESQEVCEQTTIDRGDGFAEVVEDCHTESQEYCDYTVDEWTTIQTYTLDGHDNFPVYEQPSMSSDQRLGDQNEDLTVTFNSEKGAKTYSPANATEFQQYQVGSTWTLSLNALGSVVDIKK